MNRLEVAIWARRICGARNAEPHAMLNIAKDATLDEAQQAFHELARVAHPDLHRSTASAEELELITTAFALVAAGYQTFRSRRPDTGKLPALARPNTPSVRPHTPSVRPHTASSQPLAKPAVQAVILPEKPGAVGGASQMSPRAQGHYRKAEQALRRGEIAPAILHMKMAIAADPQSTFLRQAMKEVEAELGKKG